MQRVAGVTSRQRGVGLPWPCPPPPPTQRAQSLLDALTSAPPGRSGPAATLCHPRHIPPTHPPPHHHHTHTPIHPSTSHRSARPAALAGHRAPRRQARQHPHHRRRRGGRPLLSPTPSGARLHGFGRVGIFAHEGCGDALVLFPLVPSTLAASQPTLAALETLPLLPSKPTPPSPRRPQVKLIDFGAACDLCTGINFNPEFGMLDPRYAGGAFFSFFVLGMLDPRHAGGADVFRFQGLSEDPRHAGGAP